MADNSTVSTAPGTGTSEPSTPAGSRLNWDGSPTQTRRDGIDRGAVNNIFDGLTDPLSAGLSGGGFSSVTYKMRGYRPGTADYETWTSDNGASLINPSGQPVIGITVVGVKRTQEYVRV